MDSPELTRRKVLAGLAVGGSTGVLVGSGTGALFTDEETFANNAIAASESISGVVDLAVSVDTLAGVQGLEYTVTLPEGINNNPSYVWVRTKQCPTPAELAEEVKITITTTCPDDPDDNTPLIEDEELLSALNELREGQLICSDAACLQPGDSQTLTLEVTEVDDDFEADDGQLSFQLEFYGQQCRYVPEAKNPFGSILSECGTDPTPTDTPTETPTPSAAKAISYIAFCSSSGEALDPDITGVEQHDDDGDPVEVEWETSSDVDYVVVKSGPNFTIYDYREGEVDEDKAKTGGDPKADFYGEPSASASADPCALAADMVDDGSFPADGTSVKLTYCDSEFKEGRCQ